MAKGGAGGGRMRLNPTPPAPWERTPAWHPRRWFGWTWRQRYQFIDWYIHEDHWNYQTDAQRVAELLNEAITPNRNKLGSALTFS